MITALLIMLFICGVAITLQAIVPIKTLGGRGRVAKGQSAQLNLPQAKMPIRFDRRKLPRGELARLDRRTWQPWVLSLTVTLALALGVVALFYPAMKWRVFTIVEARLIDVLPQLIVGLMALVFLEAIYIIVKQRELNDLRNSIMAMYDDSRPLAVAFTRDPLTGALDRRALPDVLKRETTWVDRYRTPLCLVLFNIREFKRVNEKEGNLAGDLVLKELAQALHATVRQTDTILRYGPDQFLCFLPRTDLVGAEAFTRRVSTACQRSGRLRGLILDLGSAVYEAGKNSDATLAHAEQDLAARRNATKDLISSLPRQGAQSS